MSTTRNYIFYKFVCINDDVSSCYVGSTGNFKKRKGEHKSNCNNENRKGYNCKIYQTIRENGGWDNWKMIEIGKRESITKREAEQTEEEYRKELKADMNTQRAFRTEEENKEYRKEYYQNNKEHIKEYKKEYDKEYRENNKEHYKEYYENNKERLSKKHECECGSIIITANKARHEKSKTHCDYINNQ
jgi:hypothetical protein